MHEAVGCGQLDVVQYILKNLTEPGAASDLNSETATTATPTAATTATATQRYAHDMTCQKSNAAVVYAHYNFSRFYFTAKLMFIIVCFLFF